MKQTDLARTGRENTGLSWMFIPLKQNCKFLKASAVIRVSCNVQISGEVGEKKN